MQQEVDFDQLVWCEGPYGCSSPETALAMVVLASTVWLCFTPNALRFLLPLFREPQALADEIGIPEGVARRYVAIWAGLSAITLLWALGAWIDPLPQLVEPLALVGRLTWVLMFLVGFTATVTLIGHLATLKIRRWQGHKRAGPPGRPTWDVIQAVGLALGFFWVLGFLLTALVTLVEILNSATLP